MKTVTLEDLEKIKQGYLIQQKDTQARLLMLDGAIQATDSLIKFMKEEIEMDTIQSG